MWGSPVSAHWHDRDTYYNPVGGKEDGVQSTSARNCSTFQSLMAVTMLLLTLMTSCVVSMPVWEQRDKGAARGGGGGGKQAHVTAR